MRQKMLDWFGFGGTDHGHDHGGHDHSDRGGQGHTHGVIDATIATTERGIWAIKWSFIILAITAALQVVVVAISGSVALLADTIHNFADAATAIPLWIAFVLARRKPTATFPYGLGRVEDLAGVTIVLITRRKAACFSKGNAAGSRLRSSSFPAGARMRRPLIYPCAQAKYSRLLTTFPLTSSRYFSH
jgi:hypothetical protein